MIKSAEEVEVGLVLTLSSLRTIIIPDATE